MTWTKIPIINHSSEMKYITLGLQAGAGDLPLRQVDPTVTVLAVPPGGRGGALRVLAGLCPLDLVHHHGHLHTDTSYRCKYSA